MTAVSASIAAGGRARSVSRQSVEHDDREMADKQRGSSDDIELDEMHE